ncbi:MAG: NADH-quinone oxidoreductase subunit M [Gemmatales bacterium]|nr:NADH-quinone oxidoreductase subunit M [Gemmatales bacterium]MDW8387482.1 NADH-quinone oxidoreductase subunit M [Gemmatales bacterium]
MTVESLALLLVVFLPVIGAVVVAILGPDRKTLIRWLSLGTSLVVLVLSLLLTGAFLQLDRSDLLASSSAPADGAGEGSVAVMRPEFVPGASPDDPSATTWNWVELGAGKIQFYLGVDGISIWLVFLTAVLFPATVLISWNIEERVNEYFAWLLTLKTAMLGVFVSFDIVLFYIFFEATLIPLFFLIGIWGGPERRYAARKFFIYTFVGSVLTLVGVVAAVLACYDRTGILTFSIPRLAAVVQDQVASADPQVRAYWHGFQALVFALLAVGFAVKVPLVPLHTWLPLAHVEAPTAGSVDLAGVLLKIGSYGFLRLCIPLAPDASLHYGLPILTALAVTGIIYGAFCAYSQDDVKRLVAYSSISHLGLVMLGMFSLTTIGLAGSLMQMVNHGLTTGGLFLLVGMIYDRYHTRKLSDFGGMMSVMPRFGVFLMLIALASVGLPGLNGFVGEVLCLFGVAELTWKHGHSPWLLVLAVTGLIWGAWYTFTMLRKLLMGPVKEPGGNASGEHGGLTSPARDTTTLAARHAEHGGLMSPARETMTLAARSNDLQMREVLCLVPIAILCVVLGVYPRPVLRSAEPDISIVADYAAKARQRAMLSGTASEHFPTTVPGSEGNR